MNARRKKEVQAVEMPAVRTTIVGGRPPGSGKMLGQIPRGIEVLVKKASVDSTFKAMLLAQRSKAADAIGLTLDESESLMLDIVPEAQLQAVIASTRVEASKKPAFLGTAAAVMLAALGAATVSTTSGQVAKGVRAEQVNRGLGSLTTTTTSAPASKPASQPTEEPMRFYGLQPAVAGVVVQPPPATTQETRPEQKDADVYTVLGIRVDTRPTTTTDPASTKPSSYPAVNAEEVEKLIKQLDSDSFAERDAASKKLTEMGLGTVPLLKEKLAKGGLSLEVQNRLTNIVNKLEATTKPATPERPKVIMIAGTLVVPQEDQ